MDVKINDSRYAHNVESGYKMSKSNHNVRGFRISTVTVTAGPTVHVGPSFESPHMGTTVNMNGDLSAQQYP